MPEPSHLDSLAYALARYATVEPTHAFPLGDASRFDDWRASARDRLLERLGRFPTERASLDPRYDTPAARPGYTRHPVTFTTRDGLQAFAYLLVPEGLESPAPGVLCLPGHGRGVDDLVGVEPDGSERDRPAGYQHDFAVQCVRQGHVVLALEMLGFGRRRDPAARSIGPEAWSCQPAAGAALLLGETMAAWRVWDAVRALDLLSGRPEVDPSRLAVIGISGGGTVGLYTAALDDRVQAAVLSCSFCTFRDSIYSVSHCIDNYVPGLLLDFEMADLAGLVAPRYLFVENGEADELFPAEGVAVAVAQAQQIYAALGVPDHFGSANVNGGHEFHGHEAFAFLSRSL